MKKVLIISSSLRRGSNSESLADEFARGAAEDEEATPERAVMGLTGWIDCFEKARLAGTVFAGGVNDPDEIKGHPALAEAYAAGNKIQ